MFWQVERIILKHPQLKGTSVLSNIEEHIVRIIPLLKTIEKSFISHIQNNKKYINKDFRWSHDYTTSAAKGIYPLWKGLLKT